MVNPLGGIAGAGVFTPPVLDQGPFREPIARSAQAADPRAQGFCAKLMRAARAVFASLRPSCMTSAREYVVTAPTGEQRAMSAIQQQDRASEEEAARILQLGDLCSALFLGNTSVEDLRELFRACPLKDNLSDLVSRADGASSEDPEYGEREILRNPARLRDVIDSLSEEDLGICRAFRIWKSRALAFKVAIEGGDLKGLHTFLSYGAKICQDGLKWAIICAAERGHLAIIQSLLTSGGTINTSVLDSALLKAIRSNHFEVVQYLLSDDRPISPVALGFALKVALEDSKLDVVEALLNQSRSICPDELGGVLCILAKFYYSPRLTQLLLSGDRPIDPDAVGRALVIAAEKGLLTLAQILLDHKGICGSCLYSALGEAAQRCHFEMVRLLLKSLPLPETLADKKTDLDEIADAIFSVRSLQIQARLFQTYATLLQSHPTLLEKVIQAKSAICRGNKNKKTHFLQLMLFFLSFTQDEAKLAVFLTNLENYAEIFKSSKYFYPLLHCLDTLANSPIPNKELIVLSFFRRNNPDGNKVKNEYIQSLSAYVTALISLQSFSWTGEFFRTPYNQKKDMLLDCLLSQLSSLESISFSKVQFERVFKDMRNPKALFLYLRTVLEFKELKPIFAAFLNHVMDGSFREWRSALPSAHSKEMEEKHPAIWKQWISPSIEDADVYAMSTSLSAVDALGFLAQKIREGHHRLPEGTIHPLLVDVPSYIDKSKEELQETLRELERAPGTDVSITQIALLKMILSSDPSLIKGYIDNAIERLRRGGDCELIRGLEGLKRALSSSGPKAFDRVIHTRDFEDLFLSGTEIMGSCQSVNAESDFNRCLMAYVVDAKNSMIAFKSGSNQIESRAILRLLFKDGSPVLFLDKVYSKYFSVPAEQDRAIKERANRLAEALGVALYVYDDKVDDKEAVSLESLGTSAPFEYEDAMIGGADGAITQGIFTVRRASMYMAP